MILTDNISCDRKTGLQRCSNDGTDTSTAIYLVRILINNLGTHKAPKDRRPESAILFLVLSFKSLMKVIGNAASEKSTHVATAFND